MLCLIWHLTRQRISWNPSGIITHPKRLVCGTTLRSTSRLAINMSLQNWEYFGFVVDSQTAYLIPLPVSILETSCNRGRGWSEVLPPASSRCLCLWLVHSLDGDLYIHRNCRLYRRNQRNLLSSNHLYLSLRMLRRHHPRSSLPRLDLMQLLILKLILFLISCPAPILDLLSLISYKFVG